MRFARALPVLLLLAVPLAAQAKRGAKPADPNKPVSGGANLPAGWSARTDAKGKEPEVKFVVMDKGYHLSPGQPTILWRATDKAEGAFRAVALITQTKPSYPPDGYGLFVGGQGLAGEVPKYTCFLIRQDGTFLIQRRDGESTMNLTSTWTAHPAILRPNAVGESTNRLEVTIAKNRLAFTVNGKDVYTADPRLVDGSGVVGLRVNTNVELHIDELVIKRGE